MSWHPDPHHGKVDALGNIEINEGEGDGNTEVAIEYVVEETIAGVVVLVGVALKLVLGVEDVVNRLDHFQGVGGGGEARSHFRRQGFKLLVTVSRVEVGVFLLGDRQGRSGEIDHRLRFLHQSLKPLPGRNKHHRDRP